MAAPPSIYPVFGFESRRLTRSHAVVDVQSHRLALSQALTCPGILGMCLLLLGLQVPHL